MWHNNNKSTQKHQNIISNAIRGSHKKSSPSLEQSKIRQAYLISLVSLFDRFQLLCYCNFWGADLCWRRLTNELVARGARGLPKMKLLFWQSVSGRRAGEVEDSVGCRSPHNSARSQHDLQILLHYTFILYLCIVAESLLEWRAARLRGWWGMGMG